MRKRGVRKRGVLKVGVGCSLGRGRERGEEGGVARVLLTRGQEAERLSVGERTALLVHQGGKLIHADLAVSILVGRL